MRLQLHDLHAQSQLQHSTVSTILHETSRLNVVMGKNVNYDDVCIPPADH